MAEMDWGGFLRQIGSDLQSAQRTQQTTPSAIQEYMYWNSLSPQDQQRYLNVKRAQQVVNLGGTQGVLSPVTGGGLSQEFAVTPKPEDMPEFKRNVAAQTAIGTAAGTSQGAEEKKYIQAPQIAELVQEAKALLPQATSGGFQSDVKAAKEYFGGTTDASGVDASLNVIGSKLTANVPRFEGPQSDKDVAEYKNAAGDVANSRKPIKARLDALNTIEKINNKYLNKEYSQPPAPSFTREQIEAELARRGAK